MSRAETYRDGEGGFTLIELLVALTIFAIVSLMAFQGVAALLTAEERVAKQQARIEDVERAVSLFARDIENLAPRPVRTGSGNFAGALVFNNDTGSVTLTRSGWPNPAEQQRSSFQRVAWTLTGGVLTRAYWLTLDTAGSDEPVSAPLLDGITKLTVRARLKGAWQDSWPPQATTQAGARAAAALLPEAVEFTMEINDFGKVRRLIVVAPPVAATPSGS